MFTAKVFFNVWWVWMYADPSLTGLSVLCCPCNSYEEAVIEARLRNVTSHIYG